MDKQEPEKNFDSVMQGFEGRDRAGTLKVGLGSLEVIYLSFGRGPGTAVKWRESSPDFPLSSAVVSLRRPLGDVGDR